MIADFGTVVNSKTCKSCQRLCKNLKLGMCQRCYMMELHRPAICVRCGQIGVMATKKICKRCYSMRNATKCATCHIVRKNSTIIDGNCGRCRMKLWKKARPGFRVAPVRQCPDCLRLCSKLSRGLCSTCYLKAYPDRGRKTGSCACCLQIKVIAARKMCETCYAREFRGRVLRRKMPRRKMIGELHPNWAGGQITACGFPGCANIAGYRSPSAKQGRISLCDDHKKLSGGLIVKEEHKRSCCL